LHHDLPVDYTSSGGEKKLVGGSGNEVLYGGRGSDIILGNEGNDLLIGNDFLSGKVGEYSHPVKDTLSGGEGNDVFAVDNDPAGKDVVTCGGGFDRVFADSKDVLAPDCEKVGDRVSEFDEVGNSIPQSFWKSLPYPFGPQYPSKPRDYAKAAGLAKAFDRANINPLVGDWRRNLRCEEYERRMKQAGLADVLRDNPCQGKNGRQHDHIFYRDGRFTSVGGKGAFQDNGHYILPNDHTIVFPGSGSKTFPPVTAHFRFSDHLNTVTFDLVVPKNLDECSESCQGTYEWAISVFYSGLPWHRVCQGDNKDNNVNGRTDELGEPCWIDPVDGLTY
jgi:Ca2+-binding RTX toxin-like protein